MTLRNAIRVALENASVPLPLVPAVQDLENYPDEAWDIHEDPPAYVPAITTEDFVEAYDFDRYAYNEDAMDVDERIFAQLPPVAPEVERASTRVVWPEGQRPRYPIADTYCMSAYVKVNGLEALALFDTGSTGVSMTPDFARVARIPLITLTNPLRIQLGCVGSRSSINFGAFVNVEYGPIKEELYVDVVNLERYDMIIGCPWLYRHGAVLDFEHRTIRIRHQPLEILSPGEEAAAVSRRVARRRDRAERRSAASTTSRASTSTAHDTRT